MFCLHIKKKQVLHVIHNPQIRKALYAIHIYPIIIVIKYKSTWNLT